MRTFSLLLAVAASFFTNQALAEDWLWWRGPERNGIASTSANPPIQFGSSADKQPIWRTPVAGRGHSSPIVVGDHVFLTTATEQQPAQYVLCLDLATGQEIWKQQISRGGFPANNHPKNTEASSTVASDGESLFATFFHHQKIELIKLDLDGNILWRQDVGSFNPRKYEYGYAPSPTIYETLVIVAAEYDGPSAITAFHRDSGKKAWQTQRKPNITFSTPIVATLAGRDQLLLSGSETVTSYDPRTGKQLWQTEGTTDATCGTVVWSGNVVIASGGYPKAETIAIVADGSARIAWSNNQKCYEQSMIVVDGYVYALTDKGILYCWNAQTGEEKWKERLAGPVSASPVYAGGHIYWANELGTVYVFAPDPSAFKLVSENRLGNSAFASPAVVGNKILFRVGEGNGRQMQEYVYCFER